MLVLVNPRSNGGAAAKRWPAAQSAMRLLRPDAQFAAPNSVAEAKRAIAAGLAAGHDAIIAAGGVAPSTSRSTRSWTRRRTGRDRRRWRWAPSASAAPTTSTNLARRSDVSPGRPLGSTWPARPWWMSAKRR